MQPTRPLGPAVKAEVTADHQGLPHGRITEHDNTAHVFTNSLNDLARWFMALGGHITRQHAGPGLVLYTLHTVTEHTNGIPVQVHTPTLDTDQLDADLHDAVA